MTLSQIEQETLDRVLELFGTNDSYLVEKYKELSDEQPILWELITDIINDDELDDHYRDGYCKGIIQTFILFKEQAIKSGIESWNRYKV